MTIEIPPTEFQQTKRRSQEWWDRYFLDLAKSVSVASKDPSTKVGAVIVRPDRTVASLGYNGFPRGIEDSECRLNHRDTKYAMIVHGEINAILTAREPLHGYCLYTWPFFTCHKCAPLVIQSGIKRVVSPFVDNERWNDSFHQAQERYDEVGIKWQLIDCSEAN